MKDLKAEMYQMKQNQSRNSLSERDPDKKATKMPTCLQKILRTVTIHPGIFLGRALWVDSVAPRVDAIASREQFKPIRIGKISVNFELGDKFSGENLA